MHVEQRDFQHVGTTVDLIQISTIVEWLDALEHGFHEFIEIAIGRLLFNPRLYNFTGFGDLNGGRMSCEPRIGTALERYFIGI